MHYDSISVNEIVQLIDLIVVYIREDRCDDDGQLNTMRMTMTIMMMNTSKSVWIDGERPTETEIVDQNTMNMIIHREPNSKMKTTTIRLSNNGPLTGDYIYTSIIHMLLA